jgi:hypothetical protein
MTLNIKVICYKDIYRLENEANYILLNAWY